jgi:hypothetical protein
MKPQPLSYSTLDKFKTCGKQYYHLKVVRDVKDVKGDAALWGEYVHIEFEKYLLANGTTPLPDNLLMYRDYLDAILAMAGDLFVELSLSVDTRLEACDFDAPNVFLRGYADVVKFRGVIATALDHKTGKRKPDSTQMRMMALLIFLLYPAIQRVRVAFCWLKETAIDSEEFNRGDMPDLWNTFLPDIQQYREAYRTDVWQPRPSGLCHGWCPVRTCEFWKPKRLRTRP